MADEDSKLKAGHPPAVKAGGMRIVQHKGSPKELGKDPVETIGLSNPPPNLQTEVVVSGSPPTLKSERAAEINQAHNEQRPAKTFAAATHAHNIQQPRK